MSEARYQSWVVYAIVAVNVAMFGVQLAMGMDVMSPRPQDMVELGASYPPLTLHGEWWRLGSSMFLHFGIIHLALNMLCLIQVQAVEAAFGRVGFLVIYLVAGLGGGVASLLANSGNVVIAGASGCVFGAYGAFGAKLVLHRARFEYAGWASTMRRLGLFLAINLVVGLKTPGISLGAHIGGFIVGAIAGAALLVGAHAERTRLVRALVVAVLGVGLSAAGVAMLDAEPVVPPVFGRFDAVERTTVDAYNALHARYEAHEIKDAEFADMLETAVMAPYRAVHQDLRAAEMSARWRPLAGAIDQLMASRIASLAGYQQVLRETDPAKQEELRALQKARDADLETRTKAVQDELARLGT